MKAKLLHYLTKEGEILNDIFMQTKEIMKSLEKDDIFYAVKLLEGRGKNIAKADEYNEAITKILNRFPIQTFESSSNVGDLLEKVKALMRDIKSVDDEICKIVEKDYTQAKKERKTTQELELLKNSYLRGAKKPHSKSFDKKT